MSRSANTKLFGLKANGNKISVCSLSCETDFVSGTDMFKNYSYIILNIISENGANEIKEEEFEKVQIKDNKIDKSFDNLSILEGLKILISKTQENCKIGHMQNFDYTPANENTKSFIGTYLHTSPSNYPNLGVKASFVVLSAEAGEEPINKHAEDELNELSSQLAMQIVACSPKYLNRSEIPADVLEHETKIIQERVTKEAKPEFVKKLVDSALKSWIEEKVLNEQNFVIQDHETNEGKINVQSLIAKYQKKLKLKNLHIKDFKLFA
jgi:elongation factor Ts